MTLTLPSSHETLQRWRRQIGQRARPAQARGPRPFAVVSYLRRDDGGDDRTVDLSRLTLVALFDQLLDSTTLATRLVGIGGAITDEGLTFGGIRLNRFDKDLRLTPTRDGRGKRFALDSELLQLALTLERYLERCANHPFMTRRRTPLLPLLPTDAAAGGCRVDLTNLPKRQVIALSSPEHDLCGRVGGINFDFFQSRFRSWP